MGRRFTKITGNGMEHWVNGNRSFLSGRGHLCEMDTLWRTLEVGEH